MYYVMIGILLAADQIIKKIIAGNLEIHAAIPVIGDFFRITYIQNTGAAFSLFRGMGAVLIAVPAVLIAAALIFMIKKRKTASPVLMWSLTLIVSGGLGNIIDRIIYGYVIDYISIGNFAIFNFADICVCIGCGLLAVYVLFIDGKKKEL